MQKKMSEVAARVEAEHESLKRTMSTLENEIKQEISSEDFSVWKLEFMGKLRDFQSSLLKHFDLEEEGDFMEEILSIAPQFRDRIERLEEEHTEIISDLNGILADLKKFSDRDFPQLVGIRKRVGEIFTTLHSHEAAERELMQDVYLQDHGPVD